MSDWKWFPSATGDWSLDVITLLAVIGEGSIEDHRQFISASVFCFLPRLIPAPQALLKPDRPGRMPETVAKMTGVYSGLMLDSVGFFANLITPLDDLPALSFKVLSIKHRNSNEVGDIRDLPRGEGDNMLSKMLRRTVRPVDEEEVKKKRKNNKKANGANGNSTTSLQPPRDEEEGPTVAAAAAASSSSTTGITASPSATSTGITTSAFTQTIKRRSTARKLFQELITNPGMAFNGNRPAIPVSLFSPLHILAALSFLMTVAVVVCAIIWEDGPAIIAVTFISIAASICGAASLWRPLLMQRKGGNDVPDGDVMIRTREGAFLLVRCTEDVARELYSGTEECEYYVGEKTYKLLMAVATVIIMFTVILLGNCTWNSQLFIGSVYILLNGLYWCLGMLPRSSFWDLSRYEWEDVTPADSLHADRVTDEDDDVQGYPSFTRTLWYAVRETKLTGWVELSGAAPGTGKWKRWLREAQDAAQAGKRDWNAVERKDDIMRMKKGDDYQGDEMYSPVSP